ncbi:uncharacterized protein YjcR [Bacillus safensis]|nr:uncharacterized protein YjcR [Bacillus safensis]
MESKHIQAEKDYVKGMKYKDLAEKNGVSINTIKSWKKRHGWERKKGAHKKGGQPGNVNALGNSGGAAPIRNQNAKTHGLYSKHMPAEAFEIMQDILPVYLLWEQIQIQFTAIVRAQKKQRRNEQRAEKEKISRFRFYRY